MRPTTNKRLERILNIIERVGNKLPDPALIFVFGLIITSLLSVWLSTISFTEIDPRTQEVIAIKNLLTPSETTHLLANLVTIFVNFAPLGVVLVAMLGFGVAERAGYLETAVKLLLKISPKRFLTPLIILVGFASHSATDVGYVLVIPLAGVIFYSVGRHPLVGIAAAFAGVSGGYSANFLPAAYDPILQSFSQEAARIIDPTVQINPLCNWYFGIASSFVISSLGWFVTEKIIEPRLAKVPYNRSVEEYNSLHYISKKEIRAFLIASLIMLVGIALLILAVLPMNSPLRAPDGQVASSQAPLMRSIVPLLFLLTLVPGIVFGYLTKTFKSSRDIINAMSESMEKLGYYIVLAFFCSLFIYAFSTSNIGVLFALKSGVFLKELNLSASFTIISMILLCLTINLVMGSATAKWALLAPLLVPTLMQLGISPELTQAAYRIGDSTSNIITPLMPYFPLIVIYCQKYVKETGVGTVIAMMFPYTVIFTIGWIILLLVYWGLGLPLGLQATYVYPAG